MSAHTPTPWGWHGPYMAGGYKVSALNDNDQVTLQIYISPSETAAEDAQHIVACVNAHDALVARVAELEDALRDCVNFIADPDEWYDREGSPLNAARAALAKREA